MAKYRKKPVVVEATQWLKNGDHPNDYDMATVPVDERFAAAQDARERDYEGLVVRRYRKPTVDGRRSCEHCKQTMHVHGWIDTKEGGHIVCPGDFIITGVQGERYPCKPDIFAATYEAVEEATA